MRIQEDAHAAVALRSKRLAVFVTFAHCPWVLVSTRPSPEQITSRLAQDSVVFCTKEKKEAMEALKAKETKETKATKAAK